MTKTTTTLLEVAFFVVLGLTAMFVTHVDPTTTTALTQAVALHQPDTSTLPLQRATVEAPTELIAKAVVNDETLYHLDVKHPAPHYLSLPMPTAAGGWEANKQLIVLGAKYANADPSVVAVITAIESQFVADVKNIGGYSTATGLCQFTVGTWSVMTKRHGEKYGITPRTKRTDPRANVLMCAEYLNENKAFLESKLARDIQPTELYMANLLGAAGALSIIKARGTALAINVRPDAAATNRNLFYAKIGKHSYKARTVAEFKTNLRNKVKVQRELYGESAIAYSELLHGAHREKPIAINYQRAVANRA